MKYHIIAVFVIWLVLGTGLVAAGTLTVSLEPSLDGNGTIKATTITNAILTRFNYETFNPLIKTFIVATITNGSAQFNLSEGESVDRVMVINNIEDDSIPSRIDDPTKDIHQFVGRTLRVSVIGNLSDPTYLIEIFTADQGYSYPFVRYFDGNNSPQALPVSGYAYAILSLKTEPPRFEVKTLGDPALPGGDREVIYYAPGTPAHPSTSTSINPSFSKWMFGEGGHGIDYGGNDSKCNTCHGNLDAKPANFSDITVSNGFCFRCHYGKGGVEKGFVVDYIPGNTYYPAVPTTTKPSTVTYTPITTTAKPTAIPKIPGFEALSAIAALLVVLRLRKTKL